MPQEAYPVDETAAGYTVLIPGKLRKMGVLIRI